MYNSLSPLCTPRPNLPDATCPSFRIATVYHFRVATWPIYCIPNIHRVLREPPMYTRVTSKLSLVLLSTAKPRVWRPPRPHNAQGGPVSIYSTRAPRNPSLSTPAYAYPGSPRLDEERAIDIDSYWSVLADPSDCCIARAAHVFQSNSP